MCKNGNGEECCCCARKRRRDEADMELFNAMAIPMCIGAILLGLTMIGFGLWMKFS